MYRQNSEKALLGGGAVAGYASDQDILVTRAVFRVISYGRFKVLAAILEAILKIPFDFFRRC